MPPGSTLSSKTVMVQGTLSFPSQEGVVVQKGPAPGTAAQESMVAGGEAQGKGQASNRKARPNTKR